jgi:hypothetical protein
MEDGKFHADQRKDGNFQLDPDPGDRPGIAFAALNVYPKFKRKFEKWRNCDKALRSYP